MNNPTYGTQIKLRKVLEWCHLCKLVPSFKKLGQAYKNISFPSIFVLLIKSSCLLSKKVTFILFRHWSFSTGQIVKLRYLPFMQYFFQLKKGLIINCLIYSIKQEHIFSSACIYSLSIHFVTLVSVRHITGNFFAYIMNNWA